MSITIEYEADLTFNAARFSEDSDDNTALEDIIFWESASKIISQRNYHHKDKNIKINGHWKKLVKELKKRQKKLEAWHSGEIEARDLFEVVKVPVYISITEETEEQSFSNSYPYMFLEHYAYEIFTLANLSRPGVCDFYSLHISITPSDYALKHREPLGLSAYGLECAWDDSQSKEFPKLRNIPISETADWYRNINIGLKQKATTPIEKVLFSFQHLCKTDVDISSTVWIFHALEALFSTKVGEGFSNLINRISIVLELTPKQESIVKKRLRKLYDMRGSLIHGGFEIYHPMRNEILDYDIDSQFMEIYENLQFGTSVIISCLQRLITNKAYGIRTQESLSFIKSSSANQA